MKALQLLDELILDPSPAERPVVNQNFKDLNPLLFGYEACRKGHEPARFARGYYLIHYVESGKGVYYLEDKTYPVTAGQIFIIRPADVVKYAADIETPWSYIWIGFNGEYAKKIDKLPPYMDFDSKIFYKMKDYAKYGNAKELFLTACLYELFSELLTNNKISDNDKTPDYVAATEDYIKSTYMCDITVQMLADNIALNREYLSRKFKEKTGMTVQEYIIYVRMENAKKLLKKGLSVFQVSGMVGYQDPFNFSKTFKKKYGVSPKQYTKAQGKTGQPI